MKYIVKLTWTLNQCRITIPKNLVNEAELKKLDYLILEKTGDAQITIRGFDYGKEVEAKGNRHKD